MSRLTLAGIAVLGTLAVALVLGIQVFGGDPSSTNVVTVLGMLGLAFSQLLGHKDAAETKELTRELSKDLHNGTFERLLREGLTKLANEEGFPLEISRKEGENDGR